VAECQSLSNLTISHLPDELLLEIFDSFEDAIKALILATGAQTFCALFSHMCVEAY
jgi:hypothetical protein